MIPLIGYMVGAYILTKMFSLVLKKNSEESIITVVFAIITMVIVGIVMYLLFTTEIELSRFL